MKRVLTAIKPSGTATSGTTSRMPGRRRRAGAYHGVVHVAASRRFLDPRPAWAARGPRRLNG